MIKLNMRTRKPNRLKDFDYTKNHSYFVTICAKDKHELFGGISLGIMHLSPLGHIVEDALTSIPHIYSDVILHNHVIMPNHIHFILRMCRGDYQSPETSSTSTTQATTQPTLSQIVRLFKRTVSVDAEFSPWQKSFHDHIIRDESGFTKISDYINNNVSTWDNDCFNPKRA